MFKCVSQTIIITVMVCVCVCVKLGLAYAVRESASGLLCLKACLSTYSGVCLQCCTIWEMHLIRLFVTELPVSATGERAASARAVRAVRPLAFPQGPCRWIRALWLNAPLCRISGQRVHVPGCPLANRLVINAFNVLALP